MDELHNIIKKIKVFWIIQYVCIFLIIVLLYFIIIYAYNKVAKKKQSYIEVFFEISSSVIKNLLDKCENFSKKLHNEEDDINGSLLFYEENNEEPLIKKENTNENNNINNSYKYQRGNNKLQSSRIFKIRFGGFLSLVMTFFTVLFCLFYFYLEKIITNETYFQNELIIENAFYEVFNALREYLFDLNSTVNSENSLSRLNYLLEEIYVIRKNSFSYMNRVRSQLPYNFIIKYNNMLKKPPCYFRTEEYFLNEEECTEYMNQATKYGYLVMNSYFIEEIRFVKQLYNVIIDVNSPIVNLTLTGTDKFYERLPKEPEQIEEYFKNDPIDFFNLENVADLNIMMQSLMIPLFIQLKQITIDVITKYLDDAYFKFIIMIIAYISIIISGFILVWIPFVRNLNSIIYKTKNMLSIIPKEVLANLSNIDKLLDMEKTNINGNNNQTLQN
jgi:hypothetical protein